MNQNPSPPRGQLCIWTAVDPAHEADFNRWYDREHMQERVALPGFQSARRFKALDGGPRPYLALYDTDDLDVFTSPTYRQAFQHQTPWSLRSFARMSGTQRRVGALEVECGEGEGGVLAMFVVPADMLDRFDARALLAETAQQEGIVRAAMLRTDVALSTPVTAGATAPPADALVSVEATSVEAAQASARALASAAGVAASDVHVFCMLWRRDRASNAASP